MVNDEVRCSGQVLVEIINEAGEITAREELTNKVVASGRAYLATLLDSFYLMDQSKRVYDMRWMAMGTSAVPTVDGNIGLYTETARVQLERLRQAGQVLFLATFPPGSGTGAIGELGIFNSDEKNKGVMLARVCANQVQNKGAGDTLRVTWTISLNS